MSSNENLSPALTAKIIKEIRAICMDPPEGITVQVDPTNVANIYADIDGPQGTPFEGGRFKCRLVLSSDFPSVPPKGFFMTNIFHPNVSNNGEICVNTLKKDWKPELGLKHVLLVIRCLLIEPNPESALNEEAGKLLLDAYDEYAKRAQMLTRIYAIPKDKKKLATTKQTTTSKSVEEVKEKDEEAETAAETENEPTNTNASSTDPSDSSSPLKKKARPASSSTSSATAKPPLPKQGSKTGAPPPTAVSAVDKRKLMKKQSLRRL